jgi:hypothetical protein
MVFLSAIAHGADIKPLYEYRGCIHIHSVYSDGAGTIEHIAAEAAKADLDFIIVTDHDHLKALDAGQQGWHGSVLVLVGTEMSLGEGHCLALNVAHMPIRERAQNTINAVRKAGGLTFIAHPYSLTKSARWKDRIDIGATGMEVMSLGAFLSGKENRIVLRAILGVLAFRGLNYLDWIGPELRRKPDAELALWDEQTRKGPFVGIGSVDTHGRARVGGLMLRVPRYSEEFRAVRTHVFTREPFNRDAAHDAALVYEALGQGHCAIRYAIAGRSRGFSFTAMWSKGEAQMGDRVSWCEGLVLEAAMPRYPRQHLALVKDGQIVLETDKPMLSLPVKEKGVYRVEAYVARERRGSLAIWGLSNPIYVE